ncbi:MAG: oligoendopeptidase F [Flavobacterium sp.]|nr:oligoendopeptidase F [Flavobacterium sp.]
MNHCFSRHLNYNDDQNPGALKSRDSIEDKHKWNLKDIYDNEEKWEEDFKSLEKSIAEYQNYAGRLSSSSAMLLNCLKFDELTGTIFSRVSHYAYLAKDLDLNNAKYQSLYDRSSDLSSKIAAAGSFIKPEILAIPEDKLWGFVNEEPELKIYKHLFENFLRTKKHSLTTREEELLAMAAPMQELPYNTFSLFSNADAKFPTTFDEKGTEFQISHGRYYVALESTDRAFRERVYRGFYTPFIDNKNMLGSLFSGNIKGLMFNSKARNYKSTLEASLDANNVPVSVYNNLIETVNNHLAALHRWAQIKQRLLKLNDFHPYDTYVTLFPSVQRNYTYDEGVKIVIEALKPLGKEYIESIQKAFNNRWIDVFETKGKKSGAYSSGTIIGIHPYVLLNWNDQLGDIFTLAHEIGHNMHSYYTQNTQHYIYANYSIFVAEVASTANEALLQEYLIEKADSKEEKLALIENFLNNVTTTFFRQTRFAEFEKIVNDMSEKGESLTPDLLCRLYAELETKYWGPSMTVDVEETYSWARIPHFYYNFYVYQYATGFAASLALVEKIKKEGEPAVKKYLEFLKSGSSDYPINILKNAGVDMSSPEPVLAVINKMNQYMDEIENLIEK